MSADPDATRGSHTVSLAEEQISIALRRVEGDSVRVSTVTNTVEQPVTADVLHERIEIEHIPIGQQIETMPSVRVDGNVTIIPVVEEVIVIEKRLILKEEVHVRRIQVADTHNETVTLRKQDIVIERTGPGASHRVLPADMAPIPKQQAIKE